MHHSKNDNSEGGPRLFEYLSPKLGIKLLNASNSDISLLQCPGCMGIDPQRMSTGEGFLWLFIHEFCLSNPVIPSIYYVFMRNDSAKYWCACESHLGSQVTLTHYSSVVPRKLQCFPTDVFDWLPLQDNNVL